MDVTMPQLGETVTEGTITKWLKDIGDAVAIDEPLFEVSTDKVDSEVPSPVAGTLAEIKVQEGDTAVVGATLAVLSDAGGAAPSVPAPAAAPEPKPEPAPEPEPAPPAPTPEPEPAPAPTPPPPPTVAAPSAPTSAGSSKLMSPIVRRLVSERGLDPEQITGTGAGGRITRKDVLNFVGASPSASTPAAASSAALAPAVASTPAPSAPAPAPSSVQQAPRSPGSVTRIPFDNVRRRTAEHMVRSKAVSAHVYTSAEIDFERVERVRQELREQWKQEEGFSLTYMPFIARAYCEAIREFPNINSEIDSETLVVHHDVHLGIAIDLNHGGLIAPVIHNADGKRMRQLARDIRGLAVRARNKQLNPDEVSGGTFTITNMGPYGSFLTMPIINQPQVGILATDGISKKPVVVEGPDGEDTIAIHHIGMFALAWDHRALDGAYAAAFLRSMKEVIETRDWRAELL